MAEVALPGSGEPGVVSDGPHPAVAAVAGFLLGGVVVDSFTNVATVLIAGGTLGGMIGAVYGALRTDADAERAAGFGGAFGLVLAAALLVADWLGGG